MSVHGARRARARGELIRQLRRAGALREDIAVPLEASSSLEQSMLQRMLKRGVIRAGSNGGYWLDAERYAEWQRRSILFAVGVCLVVGAIVACLIIYDSDPRTPRESSTETRQAPGP